MGLMKTLVGGSESKTNPAFVDKTQQPFLKDIYGQAQGLFADTTGQQFGQQFQDPAYNAFNQQAAGGSMIPGLQEGYQNFGGMQNEALGGAIDAGLGQINRNFSRNIMPQINQGAAMSGTSGGSRQGIAQGLAASDANDRATDFVNKMQSDNWQNQMTNQLNAYSGLTDLQSQRNQATQGAMTVAPNLANMGFQNQWGNLNAYKDVVGSPTTLGNATSQQNGMFAPIKLQKG